MWCRHKTRLLLVSASGSMRFIFKECIVQDLNRASRLCDPNVRFLTIAMKSVSPAFELNFDYLYSEPGT
jgi:hypothetical protein